MRTRILITCLALAGPPLACAQELDPLKSPACGQALQALQTARTSASAADPATAEELRASAARICLGQPQPPLRPSRSAQPPVVAAPISSFLAAPGRGLPVPPEPPLVLPRPMLPSLCDANGCWTNDGTHLRQVAPGALGPQGACVTRAGAVYCP